MQQQPLTERVAAVSALDEPIRRALFEHVSRSDSPVGRDEAAEALGLARSTAAFHLDRLAEEGLLAVEFKRLTGRTGPGSGRPAKLYRRAAEEIAVSVPERHYDLVGQMLLTAIEESTRTGEPAGEALLRVAGETGRTLGSGTGSLQQVLEDHGYEPRPDGEGGLVLRKLPVSSAGAAHRRSCAMSTSSCCEVPLRAPMTPPTPWCSIPGIGRCCVRAVPQHMSAESTPARQT